MSTQNYEDYWKLTVEYTDINSDKFLDTLKIIVDFIDTHNDIPYSKELYEELQNEVYTCCPKVDMGSVRKSINQFVKLGFINTKLESYHPLTKDFLEAKTERKRKTLFSQIFYSNSSFNRTITKDSAKREINFIIKTLEEVGKLHKDDIIALMLVDIENIEKGYLTAKELEEYVNEAKKINFIDRKYNQVGYLFNFLGKLEDVVFIHDELYFEEDAKNIFGEELAKTTLKKRDMYLHRLYKKQLQDESNELYGASKCMLEKLTYPVLIASHIKPFILSDEIEAYDPENGLLLSRTIDSLFDLKYISFSDEGKIIFSDKVSQDVKDFWKGYTLDTTVLTPKRLQYLEFHRSMLLSS